jgi:YD repeat-containing protein
MDPKPRYGFRLRVPQSKLVRRPQFRKTVCLLIAMSLPIWPGKFALPSLTANAHTFDFTGAPVGYLPLVLKSLLWLTTTSTRPDDTIADRLAQVGHLTITPNRFVAYVGHSLTFDAIGTNLIGQTIPGLVFNWESSDISKVQIDDMGRATFSGPGLVLITCRAGAGVAVAHVLIRPGHRPRQTDPEWRADQENFVAAGPATDDNGLGVVGSAFSSILDKLAPTAYAQSGGYSGADFGYDELWSEPRNLVGSPRNRVIEPTALGPVLPEGSNFNFAVPLIAVGGRGIGANLTLYGNTRVWSHHGSAVTFSAIGGFPYAGFSLGFGRILTYGPSNNTSLLWLDPDGTPHSLGSGDWYTNATFQTTDGTHITFVGCAGYGGTLYYSDGTQVSIGTYNNRLLATQIKDSNGNYVGITYKYGAPSPLAIDHVTDTQGRQIQFNYDGSGNLISITAPGYGGTAQNPVTRTVAQFDYQSRTRSVTTSPGSPLRTRRAVPSTSCVTSTFQEPRPDHCSRILTTG